MVLQRLITLVLVLLFLMHSFRAFSSSVFGDIGSADGLKIELGGRKTGAEKVLRKGIVEAAGKASEISGATLSFEGKKDSGGKCEFWDRSIRTTKNVDGARLVAFGADYHGPKRHPPKHN
ncbi:hypothetical protein SLA2020_294090 [Shorea laevis]